MGEPFGDDRSAPEERLYGYAQTVATDLFSSGGAGVYSLDAFAIPYEDTLSRQENKTRTYYLPPQNVKNSGGSDSDIPASSYH